MGRIPRHPGGRKQNFDRPDVANATGATNREIGSVIVRNRSSLIQSVAVVVKQKATLPDIKPRSLNLC